MISFALIRKKYIRRTIMGPFARNFFVVFPHDLFDYFLLTFIRFRKILHQIFLLNDRNQKSIKI